MEFMSFLTGAFIGAGIMFVAMLWRRPRLDDDHHFHTHVWFHRLSADDEDPADWWKAADEDP